jgi:hypothetical protein
VVGPLARDEAQALALTAGAVVGHRDFQRRVDRFRARVREEDVVVRLRQDRRKPGGELEGGRLESEGGTPSSTTMRDSPFHQAR